MRLFFRDLNENISETKIQSLFNTADMNKDQSVDFNEFVSVCYMLIKSGHDNTKEEVEKSKPSEFRQFTSAAALRLREATGDVEKEDIPEDIVDLPPEQQQMAIKRKAFTMLFFGTLLVLVFSGKNAF